MRRNLIYFGVIFLFATTLFAQSTLDNKILAEAKRSGIKALDNLPEKNHELYEVGRVLFADKILSGNRNIACISCHRPDLGTSDGLMLSVGQGRLADAQGQGVVLQRHAPSLFDLGQKEARQMFWDSRVSQHWSEWRFETPEPRLNGLSPSASHIFKTFKRAVDVQALFPLRSPDEMLGKLHDNELANSQDNLKIWDNIEKRLMNERPNLMAQLAAALNLSNTNAINIGHIGNALGEFISYAFQAGQTPMDRYLRGDLNALSTQEKEGFLVYLTTGRCGSCHNGALLSNGVTMNIGVPPIKTRQQPIDLGRYELTKSIWDYAMFRTPRLRNVSLSAPYMHNGIYRTLEEVIDHYQSTYDGLYDFQIARESLNPYQTIISRVTNLNDLHKISDSISPFVESSIRLKPSEREALLIFLRDSLTDPTYLDLFP